MTSPPSLFKMNSCLVPLNPGVRVSRVIASSSKSDHFDIKAEVCCSPLHAEENVMGEWPCERLVQPQDNAEPPRRSGQCIPLWVCSVKAEWPYAWPRGIAFVRENLFHGHTWATDHSWVCHTGMKHRSSWYQVTWPKLISYFQDAKY